MLFVFFSFLATLLFGFSLLLLVNYALVDWEKNRVEDLARQIRQQDSVSNTNNILSKTVSSHRFTNVDLKDNLRSRITRQSISETASQIYTKTITTIKNQDYAGWWQKIVQEFNRLKQDWLGTVKSWLKFLISLARSVDENEKTANQIDTEKEKNQIAHVVEKVKGNSQIYDQSKPSLNYIINDAASTFELVGGSSQTQTPSQSTFQTPSVLEDKPKERQQDPATIALGAAFDKPKTDKDMTQFEKIERKILDRLQESGLKDYDIWLQLGDFYLKYDEKEKAKEIYALVLKQADGEQKEIARNRLISF